jgi:hypothetical protein
MVGQPVRRRAAGQPVAGAFDSHMLPPELRALRPIDCRIKCGTRWLNLRQEARAGVCYSDRRPEQSVECRRSCWSKSARHSRILKLH